MNARQHILAVALLGVAAPGLYLLLAYPLLRDPGPPEPPPPTTIAAPAQPEFAPPAAADRPAGADAPAAGSAPPPGRKRLEIHGRVLDARGLAIAGALIAEERYAQQVRSDAEGRYRLVLEIPRYRYPVLHFLRSGYAAQRIKLGRRQLGDAQIHALDITLADALDSVTVDGWISNDIGIGLAGARVELTATYPRNSDSYTLTQFSDERGQFSFEGIGAGQKYKLSVNLAPEYPLYENPEFHVTAIPTPIEIVLPTLQFVDVDGMVLDRDRAPVPDYEIYISNLTTGTHVRKIVSDSSGFFSLRRFPLGEVSLTTRGAEFHRISGLRLTAGAYQNLELIVDRGSHYLSGWVSDPHGIAIEKAMVTLDRKFERDGVEHTSYRSQSTGAGGRFHFANLGGGEYRITVYAFGYVKQEFTHRFDAQAAELLVRLGALD